MLLADCPLCDRPTPVDAPEGELDCATCGVRLAFAPDPPLLEVALAA